LDWSRLQARLHGKRCRFTFRSTVGAEARKIITECGAERWVGFKVSESGSRSSARATAGGREGKPCTCAAIASASRSTLASWTMRYWLTRAPMVSSTHHELPRPVCEAGPGGYKFQPKLEKRHEQIKTVQHLAPVWLKKVTRIESLLFLYFLALLSTPCLSAKSAKAWPATVSSTSALSRRKGMRRPEHRAILDVFAPLQRHRLRSGNNLVKVFEPELNSLQQQITHLLRLPDDAFRLPLC